VDSQAYYKEHEVTVSGTGSESLQVYRNFSDLPCDKKIYTHVTKDFKAPTPIQAASWPALFAGRDVIGIAETGSGKTLGFTLPALVHLSELPRLGKDVASRGPYMLCISPTRELAMQTHDVTTAIFRHANMRSICIYGGVDKYAQKDELRKGVHCIIATPGRLISLCREGAVSLGQVSYVVLDEADRMLDMGFEPDIRNLMGQVLPLAQRQTLLFSATWPEEVQALGGEFVNNPINIMIGTDELKASTSVTQVVEVMEDSYFDKNNRLVELLKANHKKKTERILIFVLYKKEVPRVERFLQQRGFSCVGISSDLGQHERVANINAFKDGSKPLLVATDVAARGLDIDNVEMVINYSFPLTVEDYVHRIGRTGRGGAKGHAHTFFTKFSKSLAGALVNVLNEAGAAVPDDLKAFGMVVKRKKGVYGDFSGRATNKPMAAPKRVKL
jgi:ATP-dependent RNA helicase DBP3